MNLLCLNIKAKKIDQKLVMGGKKIETTVVIGVFNIFSLKEEKYK